MPLIYVSCAWVAGIGLGVKFDPSPLLILSGLAPLLLLFCCRRHKKLIILSSLCFIALFGGALRYHSSLPPDDASSLQFYNDKGSLTISGTVNADPEVTHETARLSLSDIKIKLDERWQEVSGDTLLVVPRYPAYSYGDVLSVTGQPETPAPGSYLADATMFYPQIDVLAREKGYQPLKWIYTLRERLYQSLAEVLPEPQASLAQGIILGKRGNIPAAVRDDFTRTGTAHILAVSGVHLAIMAGIILSAGIWLFGRRHYIYVWLALVAIWLYALLTGMQPPVVRGAIMASLFLIAELLGRQHHALTALVFAAAIMVGITPEILRTASFQMSFLATGGGLIFLFPPLQKVGRKAVKATLGEDGAVGILANTVTDCFSISLGAIIAVWPLVVYYFGIVSFAGLAATLLALPALPPIIIIGALAGVLGIFVLPVAQVIGWVAWLFLAYMLLVVKAFAAIPVSSVEVGSADITLIWIYYTILAMVIWLGNNRKKVAGPVSKSVSFISGLPKKLVIPALLVVVALVWSAALSIPDSNLHVSFLDVGQGDAILIQKGSQQVLVDGGPSPQSINLQLGNQMPFWDRTIDLVVLTHPHADHLAGLVEVLSRYQVKQVLYPGLSYDSDIYQEWLSLVREKGIKSNMAQAGEQINLGKDIIIKVLNPQNPLLDGTVSDIDNNSVVLNISTGRVSFLLTADIMREAELELISRRAGLSSTVLKVAHHGSQTSTTSGFLAAVNPQLGIISVGIDNDFGHPSAEVVSRLEEKLGVENIYRTDEYGALEFTTDGKRLWVKTGR